jgi:hypothetical protein
MDDYVLSEVLGVVKSLGVQFVGFEHRVSSYSF